MVRVSFHNEMEKIRIQVIEMGSLCKEIVEKSVLALKNRDMELANEVLAIEKVSDELNLNIDECCMRITALQQPVARDLRFLSMMIRISDNFERICDLAAKIAEIAKKYHERPLLKPLIDIPKMVEVIEKMLDVDIRALETERLDEIKNLQSMDDQVDGLHTKILNELLSIMVMDPQEIDDALDLIFVTRYLERIGDICGKTGARIYYMVTAERIWIK